MDSRWLTLVLALVFSSPLASLPGDEPKGKNAQLPAKRAPNPALLPIEDRPGLPRVLLLGDSISIGYTLPVRELLKEKANVHRPSDNCSSTAYAVQQIDRWLGEGRWDLIYFNFGLHDAKLPPEGVRHVPPEEYRSHLVALINRMRKTGARLVWASTTPVPNGGYLSPIRRFDRIEKYNVIAREVMELYDIPIDDLHTAITPHLATTQRANDVHFSPEGSAILAGQVAAVIASELDKHPHKALPAIELAGVREEHWMIPMRDGVRLSAYLYLPEDKTGRWPAVFEQRYADITGAATRKNAADLARHGYVVAMVNYRGTHLSEGKYRGYRGLAWGEHQDGYDVCEWLARQTWCTGKIGTFGGSQGGFAQNFLAVTQPPHLACQYMVDTGLSLFQEGYRLGGVTRPNRFRELASNCRDPHDNQTLLEEWDRHPNYDDYWQAEDCSLHFAKMNVPCFTIGSWYDFMVQGSVQSFVGRQWQGGPNSKGRQQLLLGPWLHGRLNKQNQVGDLVYPENARWNEVDHMVKWFDHFLKGVDNGVDREPPVRYYVMGAVGEPAAPGNVWRSAMDWPPASSPVSYYLHEAEQLSPSPPERKESGTTYRSDPRMPMSIAGRAFPGAKDARSFEEQADVRTWTSQPLIAPLEITGEVTADVWLKSTVVDSDFIFRLSDVYPDGRSILLMDYPIRARYRHGFDRQVLMTPGEPTRLTWHIGWTSLIVNTGHRLRVTISSTGAPLYEPNNQTGGKQTLDWMRESVAGEHTILHQSTHASRVILPIVGSSE